MKIKCGVIYPGCTYIMPCYICMCLIPLQFVPRPGSQVLSAAATDVDVEGGIKRQHTLSKAQRKRPPEDHANHEWKRQKDSDSAGQHSIKSYIVLMKLSEK